MAKFEFDGEKYLKASKHQKEWGVKLIEELNIERDEHILDLGCGDGLLTRMLKDIAVDGFVVGIDASSGMIEKANEYKIKNLEFKQCDINDINFRERFTIIISNATLHWIKNHKKLLSNCYRALKNDGVIRFNFAGEGNCSHFFKIIKSKMKDANYKNYFKKFEWPWFMPNEEEYKKIINNANFSELKIWTENADRYFSNAEEMALWIDQPSIVPFISKIDDIEIKKKFRDEIVSEMIELTGQYDGRCFETFRRINIYAKK